jgi:hypothetical protein
MADNSGRTQLTIAVIGLVSATTVAFIANYDKIFPRPPAAPAVNHPTPAPGTAAPDVTEPPTTQGPSGDDAAPASAKIAGQWEDESDPFRFVFTQDGTAFAYTASENGAARGTGKGTISGKTLVYDFQDGNYAGNCRATLADDGNHISGTCKPSSGDPFDVRLRRRVP